jgi:hypothetical protein
MKIATIEGIVESGQIRLLGNVALPEHAKVYVLVPDIEATRVARILSPRLANRQQAGDFAKQVFQISADASENRD